MKTKAKKVLMNSYKKNNNKKTNTKKNDNEVMKLKTHSHPDHSIHISRLKRVKGQIEGIERMIIDKRYCPDIIVQLRAAASAMKSIEAEVFKTHLKNCVKQAFIDSDPYKSDEKVLEVIKLIY